MLMVKNGATPEGTSDLLFSECEARRSIEQRFLRFFKSRGFSEVVTPTFEFFEIFEHGFMALPAEMMYKFFDSRGRILVMRPDNTVPIARVASTRLRDYAPPLRLYYGQRIFRMSPTMTGRSDEQTQCGIELIGAGGRRTDLEVLQMAVTSLQSVPNLDFCVEIGHVGFYKSIIEGLPFREELKEQIRGNIETKNYAGLRELLEPYTAQSAGCRALMELPGLFGGAEVFDKALGVAPNEQAAGAVRYLRDIYNNLCRMGLEKRVVIDFGLVNQIDYYSGIVFRGFGQGSGDTILSGGRYDSLLATFGKDRPATGFAVYVDTIVKAAGYQPEKPPRVLLFYEDGQEKQAFLRQRELTEQGVVCEMSAFPTLEETRQYAVQLGFETLEILGPQGIRTEHPAKENGAAC